MSKLHLLPLKSKLPSRNSLLNPSLKLRTDQRPQEMIKEDIIPPVLTSLLVETLKLLELKKESLSEVEEAAEVAAVATEEEKEEKDKKVDIVEEEKEEKVKKVDTVEAVVVAVAVEAEVASVEEKVAKAKKLVNTDPEAPEAKAEVKAEEEAEVQDPTLRTSPPTKTKLMKLKFIKTSSTTLTTKERVKDSKEREVKLTTLMTERVALAEVKISPRKVTVRVTGVALPMKPEKENTFPPMMLSKVLSPRLLLKVKPCPRMLMMVLALTCKSPPLRVKLLRKKKTPRL